MHCRDDHIKWLACLGKLYWMAPGRQGIFVAEESQRKHCDDARYATRVSLTDNKDTAPKCAHSLIG